METTTVRPDKPACTAEIFLSGGRSIWVEPDMAKQVAMRVADRLVSAHSAGSVEVSGYLDRCTYAECTIGIAHVILVADRDDGG